MPTPKTGFEGLDLDRDGTKTFAAIEFTTNQFVGAANSPRFAVQNDEITYQRILGQCRFGLYLANATAIPYGDVVVDYGLVLTKGEYSDTDGSWTVSEPDLPDPTQFVDDPDKWLFRNEVILCGAPQPFNATAPGVSWPLSAQQMSTDQQLPNGSWIDIKPRRKARYEEKLGIVYMINSSMDAAQYNVFLNYNLRVLTSKWG